MTTSKRKKQPVPAFTSEASEAAWWDARKDAVEADLVKALQVGSVLHNAAQSATQQARVSRNVTLRMATADVERARKISAQKGIGYQTLVKMLLHEALDREEKRLSS